MFALTAPKPYRLASAPLAQAVVQLSFPLQARLSSLEGIAPIQDALAERYPVLVQHQLQSVQFQVTADGSPSAAVGSGSWYEFSSEDGHRVTVAPDQMTLSVGEDYGGVEEFGDRFRQLAGVLAEQIHAPRVDRMGVRYLTVATLPPGDGDEWLGWFRPELVGWPGVGLLTDDATVQLAVQQTVVISRPTGALAEFPADVQAVIRHGVVPPGSSVPGSPEVSIPDRAFLLDIDVFVVAQISCDPALLKRHFTALHGQIDRFFRWSLTEKGTHHFGLVEGES
jgi:uncharacterized protein (TIGR04255 family)